MDSNSKKAVAIIAGCISFCALITIFPPSEKAAPVDIGDILAGHKDIAECFAIEQKRPRKPLAANIDARFDVNAFILRACVAAISGTNY